MAASVVLLGAIATPSSRAFADYTIATPTNPYVYSLKPDGQPRSFDVESGGWRHFQLVWIEICDGEPATAVGWSVGLDCDDQTSPSAAAASATGTVRFSANNRNSAIVPFHGASPNGSFNCLAKNEIPSDAKATTATDSTGRKYTYYSLSANDTKARDGVPLNPSTQAWTSCQLRVASNYANATDDQRFITLLLPSGPDPKPASSNTALYASLGAAAFVLIAAGGLFLIRRRGDTPSLFRRT